MQQEHQSLICGGARFDSVLGSRAATAREEGGSVESGSREIAPSTGIPSEEMKVATGLSWKLVGKVLEPG